MASNSPIIAPTAMPTRGNTMLWVPMASLTPRASVTSPITCNIVVRARSGIRLPTANPIPLPAATRATLINVPSPRTATEG